MSINKDEFVDFLENYLMEEEAKELEITITGDEAQDAPMIDSRDKANYFLKLMNNIKEDIDSINAICDAEIEKTTKRVNEYRESQLHTLVKQYEYYKKILKNFTEHELANSKKKSVPLAYGTLSIKKQQDKWEYDEEKLLSWFKEHNPELINTKVTESVDKKQLKSLSSKNGEVAMLNGVPVEGVTIIAQPDKFDVKIK